MAFFETKTQKTIVVVIFSTMFSLPLMVYFGKTIKQQEIEKDKKEKRREIYDDISMERFFKGNEVVIILEDKKTNKRYLGVKHYNLIEINNQEETNFLKKISF